MGHTFTNNLYHIIFSTRGRTPWLDAPVRNELYPYLGGVIRNTNGSLLRAGGIADHIHLLIKVHPSLSISDCVRTIKSNSSRWISERFSNLGQFAWQPGYASFSVSESAVPKVTKYIESQEIHHHKRNFAEELAEFLKINGIEYDPLHYLD